MSLVQNPDYEDNPNPNVLCMGVMGAVAIITLYNAGMGGIFIDESALYVDIDSEELRQEIVQSGNCAPPTDESLCYLSVGSAIEEEVLHVNSQFDDLYNRVQVWGAGKVTDIADIESGCKSCVSVDGKTEKLIQEIAGSGNLPPFVDESAHYIQIAREAEKVVSDVTNQVVYVYNDYKPVSVDDMLGQEGKHQQDASHSGAPIKHGKPAINETLSIRANPFDGDDDLSAKMTLKPTLDLSQKAAKWTESLQMKPKAAVIYAHSIFSPIENKYRLGLSCLQEDIRSVIVDYKEHPDEHAELIIKTVLSLELYVRPKKENKVHPLLMDAEMLRTRRRRGCEWFLG